MGNNQPMVSNLLKLHLEQMIVLERTTKLIELFVNPQEPLQVDEKWNCAILVHNVDYSNALLFLKAGFKAARIGWRDKQQYIQQVLPSDISLSRDGIEQSTDRIAPMIWIFKTKGHDGPYNPTQCDTYAEDFVILGG